mmetsp:Transcript_27370/g.59975  ORF Transcript_27370/g.59975 Transcript_27370/m.59975 type:complete len:212 (+) Transcript_27370:697-1332(+)
MGSSSCSCSCSCSAFAANDEGRGTERILYEGGRACQIGRDEYLNLANNWIVVVFVVVIITVIVIILVVFIASTGNRFLNLRSCQQQSRQTKTGTVRRFVTRKDGIQSTQNGSLDVLPGHVLHYVRYGRKDERGKDDGCVAVRPAFGVFLCRSRHRSSIRRTFGSLQQDVDQTGYGMSATATATAKVLLLLLLLSIGTVVVPDQNADPSQEG